MPDTKSIERIEISPEGSDAIEKIEDSISGYIIIDASEEDVVGRVECRLKGGTDGTS